MLLPADNTEITMARTPKARALGAALRQAREDKGLLLRELASAIHRDSGVLSRWETGERTPKPEHVAQILTKLDVDGDQYHDIMTLAYGTDEPQWVATTLPEQRQQMTAYVDREQNATKIVEVAPLLIPVLLQTNDYISAIMNAGGVPTDDIARRIQLRIDRREVITGSNPTHLLVLIGQGALNQHIGGPEVTVKQLRSLRDMAMKPHIDIRIIPDGQGWHPGLEGAFSIIESHRGSSIVFVETRRSMLMLHEAGDIDAYQRAVARILQFSLDPADSAKLMMDHSNRLEHSNGLPPPVAEVKP
jgi:transcriptional regulator with XRE-family HTH domain